MTSYPVNQGLVLQKVAIVPHKGLSELTPLVSTHFITTPQQLNGTGRRHWATPTF